MRLKFTTLPVQVKEPVVVVVPVQVDETAKNRRESRRNRESPHQTNSDDRSSPRQMKSMDDCNGVNVAGSI